MKHYDLIDKVQSLITKEQLTCYKSNVGEKESKPQPLYFYHTPKAGGNSLIAAIRASYLCHAAMNNLRTDLVYVRFEGLHDYIPEASKIPLQFIVSHESYGFHEKFKAYPYQKIACFRDPAMRVYSAYGYEMMRNDWLPEKEDFEIFFNDPINQNVTLKQFAPFPKPKIGEAEPSIEAQLNMALNNLKDFSMLVIAENITPYIEHFLSQNGLSNVISARMNVTLPQYRPNYPEYEAKIKELNHGDQLLYDSMKSISIPPRSNDEPKLHPYYSIAYEFQSSEFSETKIRFAHEQVLQEAVDSGNHYDTLHDFCISEIVPRNK